MYWSSTRFRWFAGALGVALLLFALWLMLKPVVEGTPRILSLKDEGPGSGGVVDSGGVESVYEAVQVDDVQEEVSGVERRGGEDAFYELRRRFRPERVEWGERGEPGREVVLEAGTFHTMNLDRITAGDPGVVGDYVVQFSGPVRGAWRARVEELGGRVGEYIPHFAVRVRMDGRTAERLGREEFVQWVHPVMPAWKVQPFLLHVSDVAGGEAPDEIEVIVTASDGDGAEALAAALKEEGVDVQEVASNRRMGWVRAMVDRRRVLELAELPEVEWIEEYVAPRMFHNVAVRGSLLNVTNVWFGEGLTGAGQIIGHADTGLDTGNMLTLHPDFSGRVVAAFARGRPGNWNDPDGHGTHTAGSAFGNGAMSGGLYRGIVWEAGIAHQSLLDAAFRLGGIPADLNELFLQTYEVGARIHTDSWGSSVFGSYTLMARQADEFMWDYPDKLLLFAAGNDGWDYDGDGVVDLYSVASPGTAKNVMTVGASENDRPSGSGGFSSFRYGQLWPFDYPADPIRNDLVSTPAEGGLQGLAAYSSRGPSNDGRTKPEVVAPGTDVASTRSRAGSSPGWGVVPGNTNYIFNGGTSMSTPLVAGAAALVRQYVQERRYHEAPSAALLRGVLIHGAVSLGPGQYGTGAAREIPDVRPNLAEGWGQVNVERALFPEEGAWTFWDDEGGLSEPGDAREFVFESSTGMVRVTLAYTDYPGSLIGGKKLVNDLDLRLKGPGGVDVFPMPNGVPDRSNNVERIDAMVMVSGTYTARVEAFNVPQGPQRFALVASGPISVAPRIVHERLPNTVVTNEPIGVEARVVSIGELAAGSVMLHWGTEGEWGAFVPVAMVRVTNSLYRAEIPAQPRFTRVSYYLTAEESGLTARWPEDGVFSFDVTTPVVLTVGGAPGPIFTVEPPYGATTFASGTWVKVSAPAFTNVTATHRMAIRGWTGGTGDLPATGATNAFEVTLSADSGLVWEWATEYALVQTSAVAGLVNTMTWWSAWSTGRTITVGSEVTYSNGNYGFAGWTLDGVRQPDPTSIAVNPVEGVIMFAPRTAHAVYLPAGLDSDGDGIPDWWERFYFGTNGASAFADPDMDGFTNLKEYQDRTNPLDGDDVPQPPSIAHVPLASPQPVPAPWEIRATVVDNHAVSNVMVVWNRNGTGWTTSMLAVAQSPGGYAGMIPAPGTNSDAFLYRVEARDMAGLRAVSGPFAFEVRYPRMDLGPLDAMDVALPAGTATGRSLVVTNFGLATLDWRLERALFFDAVEEGTGTWTRAGQNNVWHIRGDRYRSASKAWHFGNGIGSGYPNNANASLIMPPVRLEGPAWFVFDHWAWMEYDFEQMDDHYWDGGVVEISVDGGETFALIHPVGGYPHRITANPASPFPPGTPCYGETDGWETEVFDLEAFAGQTVQLRFRFGSDAFVREEGWYIDNIKLVYKDPPAHYGWLVAQTNNVLGAGASAGIPITLDTGPLGAGDTREAVLVVTGNDPKLPGPFRIPVRLHNLTRELLVTSTGPGSVTPTGRVSLLAGETTNILMVADTHYEIREILTNGVMLAGFSGALMTNFVWSAIESNAALHVRFDEILISGVVPEWWLYAYGLTNPPLSAEAFADHDGDGMLTWQEYMAGTDPLDPDSVAMPIIRLEGVGTESVVEWLSFTNTMWTYRLLGSTNLMDGFEPLRMNVPATPPVNVVTQPGGDSGPVFFRVEVE